MCKVPRPGLVKTRLVPVLKEHGAVDFYRAMLADVLEESAKVATMVTGCTKYIAVFSGEGQSGGQGELMRYAPAGFGWLPQRGSDLSHRMTDVFEQLFLLGYDRVVMRGSDSPLVEAEQLRRAFEALDSAPPVLGPDPDGGFHLVGLTKRPREAFLHPTSGADMLEKTKAKLPGCALLDVRGDIDTPEDFKALVESVKAGTAPDVHLKAIRKFLNDRGLV